MSGPNPPLRLATALVLGALLVAGVLQPNIGARMASLDSPTRIMIPSSYTPHDPIIIDDDGDFSIQGWPGNGTEEEPFIIEHLSITGDPECIYIRNTRAYVEMRNCIAISHEHWGSAAIILQNVTHAKVRNCVVDAYGGGFYLNDVNYSVVADNFISQAGYAFEFEYIDHCEILNNHAEGLNTTIWNVGFGYYIEYATHCVFTNNTASDRWYTAGIVFGWSADCEINENFVLDSESYGLILYDGVNCVICNNSVAQCETGIWVSISDSTLLQSNIVIGNKCGLHIESSMSLTLAQNVGIDNSDGWRLENSGNCTIYENEFDHGLLLEGSGLSHWLHDISDNSVNAKPLGYFVNDSSVTVDASSFGQIILANCTGMTIANGSCAVELGFCRDCSIESISAYGFTYAFYLMHSDRCTVTGNRAIESGFTAFHLDYSSNCTLSDNIVSNSEAYGFYLHGLSGCNISGNLVDGPDWPYSLMYLSNCSLANNIAFRGFIGYNLDHADNCTLANNTAIGNRAYGVRLLSSINTQLYLNRIGYNDVNAVDNGDQNEWDNGTHGNFWSDFGGEGIYPISGTAGSIDEHPFTLTSAPPEIDSPPDIEYYKGTTGNQIVWHPHAEYPRSYTFYRHGVPIESGIWNGSAIMISADWFVVGTHNYTLLVTDWEGRSVSDTVLVTVLESTTTATTSTTTTSTSTSTTTSGPTRNPQDINLVIVFLFYGGGAAFLLYLILQVRRRSG